VSSQWTTQRERGSRAALGIILWIALRLGRPSARLVLYPITLYFLIRARSARVASRLYLSRVLGRRARALDIMRHIHCFAGTILDRVFLLAGRYSMLEVRIHNEHLVAERIARRQGFLLLGSHLGSFEVLRALAISREHIPLKILMYPQHNQVITKLLHDLNPEVAESVIPLGTPGTLLAVKEALDDGVAVGLLADRFGAGEGHAVCRFFSDPAPFPTGPVALAAATGVPVVLFFGLYRGGRRYDIHFELLAERIELDRRRRSDELGSWVQRYAEHLEAYVRRAPYNWFNFFDFWEELHDGTPP
jgi:predicted LPLAT superfamily acyltransferase